MQHLRFVLVVLVFCLAGYGSFFAMGRSSFYCTHSSSYFDTAPCFQAEVHGRQVDTLVVGDSSLLYGIRPDLVAAAGGGSSYNFGMVGPSFGFRTRELIDRYLAHNGRPKAIVLYFAPWQLISRDKVVDPQWAPLGIYQLRYGSGADFFGFLRAVPAALAELPPLIAANLTPHSAPALRRRAELARNDGYLAYTREGLKPLPEDCQPGQRPRRPFDGIDNRASLAELRAHYRSLGIPVYVYLAPLAVCDDEIRTVRGIYAGLTDNIPQALPNPLFVDDAQVAEHVHASQAGVAVFSRNLADFIRTKVRARPNEPAA